MECPLCKTQHPLLAKGMVPDPNNPSFTSPIDDRGYAFCNCQNIFYTDWANIDQRIYDEAYSEKYQGKEFDKAYKNGADHYLPMLEKLTDIKNFCEIGAINPTILNEAKKKGWKTTRLDINPASTDKKHKIVIGDIEDPSISWALKNFDVIWASHLIEHLKDPIRAIVNMKDSLSNNGLLYVAMPDPYYINWANPESWGHWSIREHHILWDMDSFIEVVEEKGFECLYSKRFAFHRTFVCVKEYHLIFQKK